MIPNDFNIILATDSYKLGGHWKMLIEGTQKVYSYGEARKGGYNKILFYGLQYIIKNYLAGEVVTQKHLEEAKEITGYHLGSEDALNIAGWQLIIDEFGGKLPLEIKAVAEGSIVTEGNVLFTICNTDDRFPWLTNYVESVLMKVYYPIVVATRSRETVEIVREFFKKTSDLPESVAGFLVHDFGYRSAPSEDAAEIACSAHLINSVGTDTVPALKFAKKYYSGDYATLGFSVPASEHSIASPWGENEVGYLDMMMDRFPNGIVSVVADTNGIENFVRNVVAARKDAILKRWENGTGPINRVVVRPDSPRFVGDTPDWQVLWIYQQLESIFGITINSKGYKVLHPAVGVLYGDSLSTVQIYEIYETLALNGYSVENCVVGQGGGLIMRDIDRDVIRMAIKCSSQQRNGEWNATYKKPSDVSKASKAGRLKLIKSQKSIDNPNDWEYKTVTESDPLFWDYKDELVEVFRNGELLVDQTFDEIRARAK